MLTSSSSLTDVKKYKTAYSLERYPNITVAQDPKLFIIEHFGIRSVPYIFIYGKDKKLKKTLAGETRIDMIKYFLNG